MYNVKDVKVLIDEEIKLPINRDIFTTLVGGEKVYIRIDIQENGKSLLSIIKNKH